MIWYVLDSDLYNDTTYLVGKINGIDLHSKEPI